MILLPACVVGGLALPAQAFNDPPPPRAERTSEVRPVPQGRMRAHDSMSDSVRRIERSTRGRVLSAERMQSDGRDLNRPHLRRRSAVPPGPDPCTPRRRLILHPEPLFNGRSGRQDRS
ncbi:hypothetical protein [Luteimonas cellulosilyticus]|uniref:hypothetical protein n=1 Tax=Luteimonas cellulosilyticus TaxID=2683586 RepID=UPI00135CD06E|nr:hypothetical protein [Luteimonas cellulosilyticus]